VFLLLAFDGIRSLSELRPRNKDLGCSEVDRHILDLLQRRQRYSVIKAGPFSGPAFLVPATFFGFLQRVDAMNGTDVLRVFDARAAISASPGTVLHFTGLRLCGQ
jgi:hypothetical protein